MEPRYRLHYAPDNASLIIRLALEEIGVPYACALVDRGVQAHRLPAYLALNPNGLIPVLETPDGVMFETGAILLWLADRHGGLAPAPDGPDRVPFLKWLFWMSNTLHADMRILFYPQQYIGDDPALQSALRDVQKQRITRHLRILEEAATPPLFDAGRPLALSFYAACLLRWLALYPVDDDRAWFTLSETPRLRDHLAALEGRASVAAARTAEGLGPTPFTNPVHPTPPEGSAL